MQRTILAAVAVLALAATGCGGGDDGAGVRTIDGGGGSVSGSASGSGSAPHSGSASGSGSAPASASGSHASESPTSGDLGGYEPVSDVEAHANVVLDVCDINEALPGDGPMDFAAAAAVYSDGGNSTSGDGSARTLSGFATGDHAGEPRWDAYVDRLGDGWLDASVTSALEGTDAFEGEADAVRRQGVQKGTMNQVMIAWMFHELDAAAEKLEAGETDPASGAPHNVDEGWAFYHGAEPDCAPYATADKRGADFGTGTAVNDALLAAFEQARDASVEGDTDAYAAANDEIQRQVLITYLQATSKYATSVSADLEAGDDAAARVHQAEGWAFWRVAEPFVAEVDAAAADAIGDVLDLGSAPDPESEATVVPAVEGVLDDLGISTEEFGTFEG